MQHKIIIAGGGTGGHIFPAVAIAHALKRLQPNIEILFVGAKGKMEMEKIPLEGFNIIGLDIAGFNRSNIFKNILLPFKLLKSSLRAKKILKDFKPNVCLGVGGYASFPILHQAQKMQIPTVIQEQNSFAGKSNQFLGKKAKLICTAYDKMDTFFPADKIFKSGNPVRKNIQDLNIDKNTALAFFGLHENKKTLFVFGGSLGAQSINQAMLQNLHAMQNEDLQILWQTGKLFFEKAQEASAAFDNIKVFDFIRDMDKAYVAADIILGRAGALSIAELCFVAKACILVPYPFAAEDHQTHNAMALVNKHAAICIKDNEINEKITKEIQSLLHNTEEQLSLGRNIKTMAMKNADEIIAKKILEQIA